MIGAWWIRDLFGSFSIKSAYNILKIRKRPTDWAKNVWIKALPHKISFFLWKVLKRRVPIDDVLRNMGNPIVSKCGCCDIGCIETLNHLFLTTPIS